jgi:hypothetical protein
MTFRAGGERRKDSSHSFPSAAFFRVNSRLFRTTNFHDEKTGKLAVYIANLAGAPTKWPVVFLI